MTQYNHLFDRLILFSRNWLDIAARFALFICYFWFGILKVLGFSPAEGLVADLLRKTIPFMEPNTFIILFGLFEMLIGILFLKRGWEKVAVPLFAVHMFMTFGPLLLLPASSWSAFAVPTLEGQYILKNFALIASVLAIVAGMKRRQEV